MVSVGYGVRYGRDGIFFVIFECDYFSIFVIIFIYIYIIGIFV